MKIKDKRAFILIPFSNEFEKVYSIIVNVLLEHGFLAESAKEYSGDILQNIVRGIVLADIIIADITGLNANVMYELGIAHALKKPVILLSQDLEKGRNLPFNISHYKTIGYSSFSDINDSNALELKIKLKREIYNFLNSSGSLLNPFSKAISADNIVLSNLFRYEDYPFLKGYLDVLEITTEAKEVWNITRNLYWERKDSIYLDRIFDNIIQGKRKQLTITHSNNRTEVAAIINSIKKRKGIFDKESYEYRNLMENFRVVFIDNDFIFKFIINEIAIYNPLEPDKRIGIVLQPMEPFPQHEKNDENFIKALSEKNMLLLKEAYLRERTFDIMLNPSIVDEIVKGFIEIWNKYCKEEKWKIKLE